MKRRIILTLCALLITAAGYAQFPKYLYGIISWYGDEFAGKPTASGEIFDPTAYTAAHRTLPFGTQLEVENLDNGRKVMVVVNDRGPFADNRILDLSRQAAEEIGMLKKGTIYAKISIIRLGDNRVRDRSSRLKDQEPVIVSAGAAAPETTPVPGVIQPGKPVTNAPVVGQPVVTVQKTNEILIVTTNVESVVVTNEINRTNYYTVAVSNVIAISPYEDKIVEKPVPVVKPAVRNDDEFILDEPMDAPGSPESRPLAPSVNAREVSEIPYVTNRIGRREVFLGNNTPPLDTNQFSVRETDITPDVLLSNESYISDLKPPVTNSLLTVINPAEKGVFYIIQAGAFTRESHALDLYDLLRKNGYDVFTVENTVKDKRWIRVRLGRYDSLEKAREALVKLEKLKVKGMVLKVKP